MFISVHIVKIKSLKTIASCWEWYCLLNYYRVFFSFFFFTVSAQTYWFAVKTKSEKQMQGSKSTLSELFKCLCTLYNEVVINAFKFLFKACTSEVPAWVFCSFHEKYNTFWIFFRGNTYFRMLEKVLWEFKNELFICCIVHLETIKVIDTPRNCHLDARYTASYIHNHKDHQALERSIHLFP